MEKILKIKKITKFTIAINLVTLISFGCSTVNDKPKNLKTGTLITKMKDFYKKKFKTQLNLKFNKKNKKTITQKIDLIVKNGSKKFIKDRSKLTKFWSKKNILSWDSWKKRFEDTYWSLYFEIYGQEKFEDSYELFDNTEYESLAAEYESLAAKFRNPNQQKNITNIVIEEKEEKMGVIKNQTSLIANRSKGVIKMINNRYEDLSNQNETCADYTYNGTTDNYCLINCKEDKIIKRIIEKAIKNNKKSVTIVNLSGGDHRWALARVKEIVESNFNNTNKKLTVNILSLSPKKEPKNRFANIKVNNDKSKENFTYTKEEKIHKNENIKINIYKVHKFNLENIHKISQQKLNKIEFKKDNIDLMIANDTLRNSIDPLGTFHYLFKKYLKLEGLIISKTFFFNDSEKNTFNEDENVWESNLYALLFMFSKGDCIFLKTSSHSRLNNSFAIKKTKNNQNSNLDFIKYDDGVRIINKRIVLIFSIGEIKSKFKKEFDELYKCFSDKKINNNKDFIIIDNNKKELLTEIYKDEQMKITKKTLQKKLNKDDEYELVNM
ncbi:MAG: hypothetical protein GY830_06800 [Bacteroidetes bacterium]|nr:hypothetical protein [Bacteroidota bacterium]